MTVWPAGTAEAQTAPARPTARAIELSREMIRVLGLEKQVDVVVTAMLPAMTDQPAFAKLPPEARKMVTDTVLDVLRHDMTPKMLERFVPIYASTFSEDEMQAIISFYKTPAGQAMLAKTPQLAQAGSAIARDLIPEMQAEVARRLCEKLDCQAEKPKAS